MATFTGLALDKAGVNYTITATSPSMPALIGDTSAPFTITARPSDPDEVSDAPAVGRTTFDKVFAGGPAAREGRIRPDWRLEAIGLEGMAGMIDVESLEADEIRGLLRGVAERTNGKTQNEGGCEVEKVGVHGMLSCAGRWVPSLYPIGAFRCQFGLVETETSC